MRTAKALKFKVCIDGFLGIIVSGLSEATNLLLMGFFQFIDSYKRKAIIQNYTKVIFGSFTQRYCLPFFVVCMNGKEENCLLGREPHNIHH